ncbi:hypothetical protein [Streptomyces griseorubiginosus]|uniref:hypothetical protein n=1 Tax=Streptomyces griseorubiginosus TaxID=67304 RepID=UPI00076C687E|nr:hypothetical protein [Streptomyces griseorubiginosus]KUM78652.1 hypothetical protein AQI84_06450 [Streptomyces griseorubiginosus]
MGEQFKTDLQQLDTFIRTLEGCVRELNEARTALAHVRADQIGTRRLDESCDGFQERWKYGADQTKKMIDAISEGVKTNKEAYEAVEEALDRAFKDVGKASTGAETRGAA